LKYGQSETNRIRSCGCNEVSKCESVKEDIKNINNDDTKLFPSVVSQTEIKQHFNRILDGTRMAHAFLFIGQEGTGRLAMALEIARVMNCESSSQTDTRKGCNCNSCRNILSWQHPNLYPIFPLPPLDKNKGEDAQLVFREIISSKAANIYAPLKLSGTGRILIDQIRELRSKLSLVMDRPGKRIIIVQPAERMRDEAANAFLKLLEEPPHDCCLILSATSTRDLLPTIISRCQVVKLPPLKQEDIANALVDRLRITVEKAETAARLSQGSFTRAMQLTDEDTIVKLEEGLDFLRSSVMGNVPKIINLAESLTRAQRSEVIEKLTGTSFWIRDALTLRAFGDDAGKHRVTSGEEDAIAKIASRYSNDQLQRIWHEIEGARVAVDENGNVPLILIALSINIRRIVK